MPLVAGSKVDSNGSASDSSVVYEVSLLEHAIEERCRECAGRQRSIWLRLSGLKESASPKFEWASTCDTWEKDMGFEMLEPLIDLLAWPGRSGLPDTVEGWLWVSLGVELSKCWINFMSLVWNFSLCISFSATFFACWLWFLLSSHSDS